LIRRARGEKDRFGAGFDGRRAFAAERGIDRGDGVTACLAVDDVGVSKGADCLFAKYFSILSPAFACYQSTKKRVAGTQTGTPSPLYRQTHVSR